MANPQRLRAAVEWCGDHIAVIDQTRLPEDLVVAQLRTVEQVCDAIRRLVVRGAPAIGACAALGMVVGLDEDRPADATAARAALATFQEHLEAARPTAVNLSWAVRRVRHAAERGDDPEEIRRLALAEALEIVAEDREACRRIGEHGARELAGRPHILTHCNAGRLATAGTGTALAVVYALAAQGVAVEVMAPETRPLLQGARLTAWELSQAGIPVTVVADGAAAAALAAGKVDAVVVGADRIAANGDTANKIGTYAHALAAAAAGIPFYVAAPLSTFDRELACGRQIRIEEREASEVRSWRGVRSAPDGAAVWNPAFDITPAHLIAAFITEVGVLRPPYEASIADAFGPG